eukprot:EG_transcript_15490
MAYYGSGSGGYSAGPSSVGGSYGTVYPGPSPYEAFATGNGFSSSLAPTSLSPTKPFQLNAAPLTFQPTNPAAPPSAFGGQPAPGAVGPSAPTTPPVAFPPALPQDFVVAGSTVFVDVESDAELLAGGVVKLCSDEELDQAFASTLELLKQDILPHLRPQANGRVPVAVPFCGGFTEAPVLDAFLRRHLPALPADVQSVDVYALDRQHSADYSISKVEAHPKITYTAVNMDLAWQPMPRAALSLAIHPLATAPGWDSLVRNVVAHSDAAIFFLFAQCEQEALAEVCEKAGFACTVRQNPFGRAQFVPRGMPVDDLKKYNWLALVKKAA